MRTTIGATRKFSIFVGAVAALIFLGPAPAWACPFCSPPGPTLAEDVAAAQISVLARRGPVDDPDGDALFQVVEVFRGAEHLPNGGKGIQVKAFCPQPAEADSLYLLNSDSVEILNWATPSPLSPIGVEYLRGSLQAPASGAERLAYFQNYLQSKDPVCRSDSYAEFAKAPYEVVLALRPHLDRQQLLNWLSVEEPSPDHKRLYLTLLGVCGQPGDAALVAEMLKPEKIDAATLDATVGCYLTLAGEKGLEKIEREFLSAPSVDLSHVAAVVQALRFHGEEGRVLSRERISRSMKLLLARPDAADQVIFDLSRWEDWSVVEQLTQLFKENDVDYIRMRVVTYLRACPLPEAKAHLEELGKLDPRAVANSTDPRAIMESILRKQPALAPAASGEAPPEITRATESTGERIAAGGAGSPSGRNSSGGPSWKATLPPVRTTPNPSQSVAEPREIGASRGSQEVSSGRLMWMLAGTVGIIGAIAAVAGAHWRSRTSLAGVRR